MWVKHPCVIVSFNETVVVVSYLVIKVIVVVLVIDIIFTNGH